MGVKKWLFRKLAITFTLLSLITLSISALLIYSVTKEKVSADFKESTMQILKQNEMYIKLIDESIEVTSIQMLQNKDIAENFNVKGLSTFEQLQAKNRVESYIKSIGNNGSSSLIKV
ncbi:hypothetical protein [Clostridium swellfunianum]|uniref:hypothetical protein n=1 Tax=Clostridium swellfunianum TaxID=1367462 RepID=UPI002030CF51|nr:hypothetical protein [Clostridium swellfunianum]